MDKQKLPPPVSTKITRKLASESTEHNSLLNFYSSISTDETGAPKRWKMSTGVHFDEDIITSGRRSPALARGGSSRDRSPVPLQRNASPRDSSSERKGRPTSKRGAKDKIEIDNTSSRESSLEGKDKGKVSADTKRASSAESRKGRPSEESGKKMKGVDKSVFYSSSSPKVNGEPAAKAKRRPKSLELKSENGEDESFKSPDPLTPCNITVKRKKGRPKETPPTLVAESPVELVPETSSDVITDFHTEELAEADVEDNIEPVVKKKKKKQIKASELSKNRVAPVVLAQKKHLKGRVLVAKLKKSAGNIQRLKVEPKIPGHPSATNPNIKRKVGRPPGAKNKATLLKEQLANKALLKEQLANKNMMSEFGQVAEASSSAVMDTSLDDQNESNAIETAFIKNESSLSIGSESYIDNKLKVNQKSKKQKILGLKEGGIKSLGKVKKEVSGAKKVRKKRILNSYATNSEHQGSFDHLPKNDLRRYLQMKLFERLNGNRQNSFSVIKAKSEKEVKSEVEEVFSEEDSLGASDPMKNPDMQNLSALVEQKRVGLDIDTSAEQRQSSRTRKSSFDLSKISDNESVSSEKSTNSSKRIFILGENNTESDDTIRTRQRVEIVPGKSRKRTLSGEFDLVDENQLRKEKKLARLSVAGVLPFSQGFESQSVEGRSEVTPTATPIKVQKKTSPKVAAIIQRLDAKKDSSSPFVSEHRKRLLKQSPFLSRMRRRTSRKNRLVDVPVKNIDVSMDQDHGVLSGDIKELRSDALLSEQSSMERNELSTFSATAFQQTFNKSTLTNDKVGLCMDNHLIDNNKEIGTSEVYDFVNKNPNFSNQNVKATENASAVVNETEETKEQSYEKPFIIEHEVEELLMDLISKIVPVSEAEVEGNNLAYSGSSLDVIEPSNQLNIMDLLPTTSAVRKRGRPKKIKKIIAGIIKEKSSTLTGAPRGRKPKSTQVKDLPDATVVRKFELRQKISRSPLDNIALKQSIEENEYIKNEVQRATKKEAKEAKIKSKRAHALAVEEQNAFFVDQLYGAAPIDYYQTASWTQSDVAADAGFESNECPSNTLEYLLSKCKPCSVVLTDFIKQLQLAQQKAIDSMDEDVATETEDSVDDSVDNSEGLGDTDTDKYEGTDDPDKVQDEAKPLQEEVCEIDNMSVSQLTDMSEKTLEDAVDQSIVVEAKSKSNKIKSPDNKKKSSNPKKIKVRPQHQTARKSTDAQRPVFHNINLMPPNEHQKSSPMMKIPDHQTARKSIDHQTARKTVPPLKIKLKGGIRKTYMVESTEHALDMLGSPPAKPLKKRKSKSSSKSGSDSDRAGKGHHHHHHKKRNKSPLAGQVGSFAEKKSKPTAIVAASPSVKPNPHLPNDPYEATFLEFIQQKEKDMARLPVKDKPFYSMLDSNEYKVDNGSLMGTAISQSKTITSSASVIDSKSQASLCSSISKNTSLVNSVINDNLNKVLEGSSENPLKKDISLFIGVMGSKANLNYFCSLCKNEMHQTDDIVLKHFALVHPGEPIMYRRVAGSSHIDQPESNYVPDGVSKSAVQDGSTRNVSSNENIALNTHGNQPPLSNAGIGQQSTSMFAQPLENSSRVPEASREEDEESDTGSLNLKIVEVVSLKDQIDPIDDIEETTPVEKQTDGKGNSQVASAVSISAYTPELKIPQFPRSSSSSRERAQDQGVLFLQPTEKMQIVQTTSSLNPTKRKTPGLITPGRLCNTFKCEKCNVHAPVLAAMVAHLRNTHHDIPRLFQCPYCRDKEAESEAQIHQHIRKNHPTDNPNPPVALSEKAKANLRTLSVRVPDNKANDASFLEKDIYMCLNCKTHMPSLEAIYDHLEQVHTEVFVFVCSACKVFKSKTEKVVLQHIQNEPRCHTSERNISLAIDGNQFARVPCLIKDKTRHKEKHNQPKLSPNQMQTPVNKHTPSHANTAQPHVNASQLPIQSHVGASHSHTQPQFIVSQSQAAAFTPRSIVQALQTQTFSPPQFLSQGVPMQQIYSYPFGQMVAPTVVSQLQQTSQFVPVSQSTLAVSVVSTISPLPPSTSSSLFSNTAISASSTSSSLPVSSGTPSVSSAPSKPTGAKKRKNLLESIQHIKMQKQLEQQAKLEKTANPSLSSQSAQTTSSSVTSAPQNSQAPPPLIRGPPPLIRFDQLDNIPLSAAVPIQPGILPQHTVKQMPSNLSSSKSEAGKQLGAQRQIQSSLFDTSDPEAFKPIQRTPVLNVPSVSRSIRANAPVSQSGSSKGNQQKPTVGGYTPLDLSKTTPTPSPANSPAPEKHVKSSTTEVANPEVYNVFNLKPSTQAQLPKQALQNKTAVHQLPPKAPGPPMPVRPNASNTLAYRPQQPHVATSQVPQVINMPLGMLNTMNNIVVTMPSFQVVQGMPVQGMPVQGMPTQFIRMSGAQLVNSPVGQGSVALAMPSASGQRPLLTTQESGGFQQTMNVNLPVFKCPYCPKLTPLTFAQVQPHIESQHQGCSVVFIPMMENKK